MTQDQADNRGAIRGCGKTLFEPNAECYYACGAINGDFCDECVEAYLQEVGYYDDVDERAYRLGSRLFSIFMAGMVLGLVLYLAGIR